MSELGPEWLTVILFGSLVLLLLAGLPLVFAIGGIATFFIIFLWGPQALPVLANRTYMAMDMFLLVAVPMFIFMGAMLQRCGIAEDMYELMYHWMGGLRGGLAGGTVLICTLFAAMVGISGAATTSMGLIALPSMRKRGYKIKKSDVREKIEKVAADLLQQLEQKVAECGRSSIALCKLRTKLLRKCSYIPLLV